MDLLKNSIGIFLMVFLFACGSSDDTPAIDSGAAPDSTDTSDATAVADATTASVDASMLDEDEALLVGVWHRHIHVAVT